MDDLVDRMATVLMEASADGAGWCWSMDRSRRTAELLLAVAQGKSMRGALEEARQLGESVRWPI